MHITDASLFFLSHTLPFSCVPVGAFRMGSTGWRSVSDWKMLPFPFQRTWGLFQPQEVLPQRAGTLLPAQPCLSPPARQSSGGTKPPVQDKGLDLAHRGRTESAGL